MVQKRKSKTKAKSKSKTKRRGFKIPSTTVIKSALRKVSHKFLEDSVLYLFKAAPKKIKISFLVRLEKAKKKAPKRKASKRKTNSKKARRN